MSAVLKEIKHSGKQIPIIYEQNNNLPIFNLQLIFKNSGYINDKAKAGLTNLTAKILDEGTKKDGAVKFARKLESKAISIDINTGFETFVIEISCLKEQYKDALKLLNQILTDPNLTKETFEKIKTMQLSKIKQKEDDFDKVASNGLKQLLYKDTSLANPSGGTLKSVKSISLDDIKENLSNILNINNLIIATGGDIEFKELQKQLPILFKSLNDKKIDKISYITTSNATKEKIITKDTKQAYIYFGSPFYIKANDKENYKAKVAAFILGSGGFGSRLMEEIRVKHGLAYSAYGYIQNAKSYCSFKGYLQTELKNQKKAKDMVVSIVDKFVNQGATQKELDAAKQFLSGSEPLRTETFSQRLNRAFHLYYKGLDFDYPKKELELIDKLTLEELNSFIKQHKEIKKLSFCIVTKD